MSRKVAVVAIGGNSLIKSKEHQTIPDQYNAIFETCTHIEKIIELGYDVVITHGNGPQVGFILLRSEIAFKSPEKIHPVPLDSCGADTQGAIGYQIQQALGNIFTQKKIKKEVVTVVTQVLVDKNDDAFKNPSKPVGPFYTKEEAEERKRDNKWDMKEDAGRGYRRVVASPIPKEIIEQDAIKHLIGKGFVVVAVGGGGIPVVKDKDGLLKGVPAVIDKDFASGLLASNIKADLFIISTAVEKVSLNFKTPEQIDLDRITLKEAEKYLADGHFAKGSMEPKIKAVIKFLKEGGTAAIITCPEKLHDAISNKTGTHIIA
ncbi:MAG TPA: carbamate kinase [Firmicutes bacterium]|nr:carbamate kinase [Bacillota bacterium]